MASTIETNENLTAAEIEVLPQGLSSTDIDQIRNSTRLDFYTDKLSAEKPEVEQVCDESEVREKQTFSKRKIVELAVLFAIANKLELDTLKIARTITNKDGVLVVLEIKSPIEGGGERFINYIIQGRHGRNQSKTTNLDQTLFDSDGMPEGGDIIAEYLDGKWSFKT